MNLPTLWVGPRAAWWLLALTIGVAVVSSLSPGQSPSAQAPPKLVKLLTLDPGHFHAGLIQKEMYPGVSDVVHVYAPLGPDVIAHVNRIAQFNHRPENPTRWQLEVHTTADPLRRMLADRASTGGTVVVLSGRNRGKVDSIAASVDAGLHVLADKPWIISSADLPRLQRALDAADRKGVIAYDVMTERYEITNILQRELVGDEAITGQVLPGTAQEPGLLMDSVHHLLKTVAGVPNLRPAWFFDVEQQGEGLSDVGTHLVDLVPWILFPDQPIEYRSEIAMLSAKRFPTVITMPDFQRVTGEKSFPAFLKPRIRNDALDYFCNTEVSYTVRGIHVRLKALWSYEAPAGAGDTHLAIVRGSRARIEVRQGAAQKYRPEVYVVAAQAGDRPAVLAALKARLAALQAKYPGVAVDDSDAAEWRLTIPDRYRTGHEAHFAEVTRRFLDYLRDPKTLPRWEKANMLAKYYVTTRGVDLSRQ